MKAHNVELISVCLSGKVHLKKTLEYFKCRNNKILITGKKNIYILLYGVNSY